MKDNFGGFAGSDTAVQGQPWAPNATSVLYQLGNGNATTAATIFNELRFAAAKSIRTSTIILASFNTVAAFATALGIFYECYSRHRRSRRRSHGTLAPRPAGLTFISSAELYPFILSLGITVQGIIFAVAQAQGLKTLLSRGCTLVAQFMLPGVFIVPYIQLVFGVEVTLRGLRSKPFPPRGKWHVSLCMAVVGMLVLANFLVADFIRTPDRCFASLFFFTKLYSVGCFALLVGISVILIGCAILIFLRLSRNSGIEAAERVAASRMIYYLVLAVVSNTFLMPFYFDVSFADSKSHGTRALALNLSMIASVVANVSGLTTGGLHLFLRSKTLSTIGPKDKADDFERQRMKGSIRIRPGSPDSSTDMLQPIRRVDSASTIISYEKEDEAAFERVGSFAYSQTPQLSPIPSSAAYPSTIRLLRTPEPAKMVPPSPSILSPTRPFSTFPNPGAGATASVTLLPATTYSPQSKSSMRTSLKPPPSIADLTDRHRRDLSMASSATVQIGLRLSSVDDMTPLGDAAVHDSTVYPLDYLDERGTARPSPSSLLAQPGSVVPQEAEAQGLVSADTLRRSPTEDAETKTPPPASTPAEPEGDAPTLSPSVYSPQSPTRPKIPSPRGVGFTVPAQRHNGGHPTRPRAETSGSVTPRGGPPTRPRADTSGSTPPPVTDKADWI